eukprot:PITA_20690
MDDFTPYTSGFQEALSNLGKVLSKCIEMNLSLSPEKCEFLMIEGIVLGHTISRQGLQVDPNKIAIIKKVPPPQKVRDVRSFLGLAGYYRRFIKDFNKLASPLFGLLEKYVEFKWTDDCQRALNELKDKLVSTPILRSPNWALPFHIHTDASNKDIGAALGQVEEKLPYAIYFIGLPAGEEGTVDDQMPDEHLFAISVLSPWFSDIANYLVSAQFPPHLSSKEKSRIMRKSASFTLIGGNLFKLGPDQILRCCVREEEVFDILLPYHDGHCGGNFVAKRTTFKILQAGYYWPTLHQDVRRYISQCDRCQRMGKPTPRDEMPLQPQVTLEIFEKWGMDFVGLINPPSRQRSYIIVCTDYLTKWAETKAIKAVTEEKVAEFLRENIFYKFGYPRELVTDQGSHFTSNLIEDLLTHHKIKHRTSTPYHPQANG